MKRVILAVLLTQAGSALAGTVRCTTYEEKTLGRLRDELRLTRAQEDWIIQFEGVLQGPYPP